MLNIYDPYIPTYVTLNENVLEVTSNTDGNDVTFPFYCSRDVSFSDAIFRVARCRRMFTRNISES